MAPRSWSEPQYSDHRYLRLTTDTYGNYLPGTTPLILAAAYGHDDAVAALLKKKADPSIVDRKGKKALDYAEEYQFDKCVALLKKK